MEERLKKNVKKDIKLYIFIAIGIIGLLLLVFGGMKESGDAEKGDTAVNMSLSPSEYSKNIEAEVERLCVGVSGGCSVDAVVSLSGGYRSVYASNYQSSSSGYKHDMVLVGNGSNEGAVLVCYENPEISGIGIVIASREDEALKNSIISLISAAFDVKTNKIHVSFTDK